MSQGEGWLPSDSDVRKSPIGVERRKPVNGKKKCGRCQNSVCMGVCHDAIILKMSADQASCVVLYDKTLF